MLKSNKDTTQIFRSLGPDNANFKAAVNASVREAEHRWPLLKITPPKKFDLTPNLSEEEKGRWLSSPIVKSENFKHALSVQSSTSKDKMAESLKKMAGTKTKPQPTPSKSKPMDVKKPEFGYLRGLAAQIWQHLELDMRLQRRQIEHRGAVSRAREVN